MTSECILYHLADLRYLVSANAVTTIAKPSAALATKIDTDEKARVAKRKEELGEEKLKELERIMQKAKEESEVAPPPEMISDFPITDVRKVSRSRCDVADC